MSYEFPGVSGFPLRSDPETPAPSIHHSQFLIPERENILVVDVGDERVGDAVGIEVLAVLHQDCLLYTSPSPRD